MDCLLHQSSCSLVDGSAKVNITFSKSNIYTDTLYTDLTLLLGLLRHEFFIALPKQVLGILLCSCRYLAKEGGLKRFRSSWKIGWKASWRPQCNNDLRFFHQNVERARRRREEEEQKFKSNDYSPPQQVRHASGDGYQGGVKRHPDLAGQPRTYRQQSCSSNSSREENHTGDYLAASFSD